LPAAFLYLPGLGGAGRGEDWKTSATTASVSLHEPYDLDPKYSVRDTTLPRISRRFYDFSRSTVKAVAISVRE
jgi:hypothetical protein